MKTAEHKVTGLEETPFLDREWLLFDKLMSGEIPWESLNEKQRGRMLLIMVDLAMENPKNQEYLRFVNNN